MTCDTWLTFVTVTVCWAVVEPTGTYPKEKEFGVSKKGFEVFTAGAADATVVTLPVRPAARSAARTIQRIGCRRDRRITIWFSLGGAT